MSMVDTRMRNSEVTVTRHELSCPVLYGGACACTPIHVEHVPRCRTCGNTLPKGRTAFCSADHAPRRDHISGVLVDWTLERQPRL